MNTYVHPHFHWIVPEQLALACQPGGFWGDQRRYDKHTDAIPAWEAFAQVDAIKAHGIQSIASLRYVVPDWVRRLYADAGLTLRHLPVTGDQAPSVAECDELLDWVQAELGAGRPVALTCLHGVGRSGTVAAAYLIRTQHLSAEEALQQVRSILPAAVESKAQEDFLATYARRNTRDLNRHMELARAVAVEAGERLREEFFNVPRGSGSHADIDHEVEVEIRRRLLEAYPDYSYTGEETGCIHKPGAPRWVVDPNDGTSAYLKGVRGSAVSIALLWDNVPVLGVVYSPLLPDNRGDLLAWAEGCGPMTRNGEPVPPVSWPDDLSKTDVVIVSQRGDASPQANLDCVQPARYRCLASIAYRFALVAAGEGVAGVSLAGPATHDFAGCHALLRGQGGAMIDQDGREVVYGPDGHASTSHCFGGSLKICQRLAKRPWGTVLQHSKDVFPVREDRTRTVRDSRLFENALGCWFGQLCGDNLGGLVEFQSADSIVRKWTDGPRKLIDGGHWGILAGQPTDDSELALCLARSLIAQDGFNREATFEAYRAWLHSPPFDIGGTTSQGLSSSRVQAQVRESSSQANGALMRCSPLALAGWNDLDRTLLWGDQDASITHPNPVCLAANRAYLRAIVAGLNGADPAQMHAVALRSADGSIRDVLDAARREPPVDFSRNMGHVLIALQNAFYRLLHSRTLEEGVVDTVRSGGDTDTNGCIAGALLGAVHGLRAVPEQWRLAVLSCRPHAGTRHPRPTFCWPVDAYPIVERLLTLRPAG